MVGRPEYLAGLRFGSAQEPTADGFDANGLLIDAPGFRFDDPNARPFAGQDANQPRFDPVWGTLAPPPLDLEDQWQGREDEQVGAVPVAVEVFGNGFQISGQLRTGQFDRLSDWINMQNGWIQIRNALQVHLGMPDDPERERPRGTLWVRLDQVAVLAERSPVQQSRPGAPLVQKRRRNVSMITSGYNLQGSIHVHAHGSMAQFLETPDPHFIPVTDMTVR